MERTIPTKEEWKKLLDLVEEELTQEDWRKLRMYKPAIYGHMPDKKCSEIERILPLMGNKKIPLYYEGKYTPREFRNIWRSEYANDCYQIRLRVLEELDIKTGRTPFVHTGTCVSKKYLLQIVDIAHLDLDMERLKTMSAKALLQLILAKIEKNT